MSTASRCNQDRRTWESLEVRVLGPAAGEERRGMHELVLLVAFALIVVLAGCRPHVEPANDLAASSPSLSNDDVRRNLDDILEFTYRDRHLSLAQHAAWQILHGVLAYQRDFLVERDGTDVRAVDYLSGRWGHEGLGPGDRGGRVSGASRRAQRSSWAANPGRATRISGWPTWPSAG